MQLAVMESANRDSELVAHPVSQCARLGKFQMMRIRGYSAADEVLLIAQANGFSEGMDGIVARSVSSLCRCFLGRARVQ
jgi:hypothetical protein